MASFNYSYHRVNPGDTNGSASTRYRMDLEHFRAANPNGPKDNRVKVVARRDRACGRSCIAIQGKHAWVRCQCTGMPKKRGGTQHPNPMYVDAVPFHNAFECAPVPPAYESSNTYAAVGVNTLAREERLERYFDERSRFPAPCGLENQDVCI